MPEVIELTTRRGPIQLALDVRKLDGGGYEILNKGIRKRRETAIPPERFFNFSALRVGQVVSFNNPTEILGEFK